MIIMDYVKAYVNGTPASVKEFERATIKVNGKDMPYWRFINNYLPEYLKDEREKSHTLAEKSGLGTSDRAPHALRKSMLEERQHDVLELCKVLKALEWSKTLNSFPEMNGELPDRYYAAKVDKKPWPRDIFRFSVESQEQTIRRLAQLFREDGNDDLAGQLDTMREKYKAMIDALQQKAVSPRTAAIA